MNNIFPYLSYSQLNKIGEKDKKNSNKNSKNDILYSNIIKPYKSSITLLNDKILKKKAKNRRNIDDNLYDINGKKYASYLTNSTKNLKTKLNNSCFFENMMELGEPHEIHRSKTAFFGACFACDLGFGVSISGLSPMTFSPYDHVTKREECGVLPESVVFEQYTRHKKSKFYKP